jgi:hypothetical protein
LNDSDTRFPALQIFPSEGLLSLGEDMTPSEFADNLVRLTEAMKRIPIGHEMDKRLALIEAYMAVFTEILPDESEDVVLEEISQAQDSEETEETK